MRYFMAVGILCSSTLYGQGSLPSVACPSGGHVASEWYVEMLLRHLAPPEPDTGPSRIIRMEIVATGRPKLVLQTDGKVYELFRGSISQNIYQVVEEMDRSCRLPPNPENALKPIDVKWEHSAVAPDDFTKTHGAFAGALASYGSIVRDRYVPLLKDGLAYAYVHTPEYRIVYDNRWEHIEIEAWDAVPPHERMDPIIAWAHAVEELAKKDLPKQP